MITTQQSAAIRTTTEAGEAADDCGERYRNSPLNKFQIASLAFLDGANWHAEKMEEQLKAMQEKSVR